MNDEEKDKNKSDENIAEENKENLSEPGELAELENKYKRALADYQNLLKQTAKEKEEFARYANEGIIREIIPVYEHLKTAAAHLEKTNGNSIEEGIKFIIRQFGDLLERFGVREIKAEGEEFDPNLMEAVESREAEEGSSGGKVAEVLASGYELNGRLIIPAKVAVFKKEKEEAREKNENF